MRSKYWTPRIVRAGFRYLPPRTRKPMHIERTGPRIESIAPPCAHGIPPECINSDPLQLRSRPAGCRFAGARRRREVDRGFVLSDRAHWPGLLARSKHHSLAV